MQDRIKWISAGMVPGLDVIAADWGCLTGYLEKCDLLAEKKRLADVLREIGRVTPTREEALETFRASYEAGRQRYAETRLARFVHENLRNADPFKRAERLDYFSISFPEWSDVETALDSLPDSAFGLADERERQAEAGKIRKRLEAIDRRVLELTPPPFLKQTAEGLVDVRESFVRSWVDMQGRCSEAIDFRGYELRGAPPAIREWYGKLQIGKSVSTSSDALLGALRD